MAHSRPCLATHAPCQQTTTVSTRHCYVDRFITWLREATGSACSARPSGWFARGLGLRRGRFAIIGHCLGDGVIEPSIDLEITGIPRSSSPLPEKWRRLIADARRCLGLYATVEQGGVVHVGDGLQVRRPAPASRPAGIARAGKNGLKRGVLRAASAVTPKE